MGQSEIIECLNDSERPLSLSEISKILNDELSKISHQLAKLLIHNEVKAIEINREQAKAFFKDKAPARRMRLYYVK